MIKQRIADRQRAALQMGFTLIELMMTIVMAAILLTLAAPSFSTLIQNNEMTADANRFLTSMMFARSEAVKRGVTTSMVANGGAWGNGWQVQAGGTVLRNEQALIPTLTLSGGDTTYQYNADGSLEIASTQNLALCNSSETGETGRQITLEPIGQLSVNASFVCP